MNGSEKRCLCVITARGGSKRIPKKNIKHFLGKPIIAYSIEAAIKSGLFDEVMVSTDSEEIATVAREYNASVPFFRSAKTSDDYATTEDVLIEVLETYSSSGKEFDVLCCLYPTAPFVTAEKLKEAYSMLVQTDADIVMPVIRFSYPPQRGYLIENNQLVFREKEYARTRSQDIPGLYHDVGQFYFYDLNSVDFSDKSAERKVYPIILNEFEAQDIDDEQDWKFAEIKYAMGKGKIRSLNQVDFSDGMQ